APCDDRVYAIGELELGRRRPLPALAVVPERVLFDHAAQQLHDDERVAFSVPVDVCEQLATDLLPVHGRLEPPFDFIAGEAGEAHLVVIVDALQRATPLDDVRLTGIVADREPNQNALA